MLLILLGAYKFFVTKSVEEKKYKKKCRENR